MIEYDEMNDDSHHTPLCNNNNIKIRMRKKWIGDTDTMALVTYEGTRQTAYET